MSQVERSSDVKEQYGTRALMAIVPGIALAALGGLMIYYKSFFILLGILLAAAGVALIIYGILQLTKMKSVSDVTVGCPFCQHVNHLIEKPMTDIRCVGCQRQIPIVDGRILRVFQVRCGFCNHLNFYSEKSTGLICENCDRVVPISTDEESPVKKSFEAYTIHDDAGLYDLTLTNSTKSEDLISCLQHMLALNRNQVKQILEEAPTVLLTGIPKKKAELLKAQIDMHHGHAEIGPTGSA